MFYLDYHCSLSLFEMIVDMETRDMLLLHPCMNRKVNYFTNYNFICSNLTLNRLHNGFIEIECCNLSQVVPGTWNQYT